MAYPAIPAQFDIDWYGRHKRGVQVLGRVRRGEERRGPQRHLVDELIVQIVGRVGRGRVRAELIGVL